MVEFSGFMAVICNRWIDEAKGQRCYLTEGHEGQCVSSQQDLPDDLANEQTVELPQSKDLPLEVKSAGANAITARHMSANANYDAAIDCWDAMVAALQHLPAAKPDEQSLLAATTSTKAMKRDGFVQAADERDEVARLRGWLETIALLKTSTSLATAQQLARAALEAKP